MALSKAKAESLLQFSGILDQDRNNLLSAKAEMDRLLHSFIWDDPVGHSFINRYNMDLKPIEGRLVPNLEDYSAYLKKEAELVTEFGSQLL